MSLPIAEDGEETARLADLIEGVAGEFSPFEQTHGFSIDGVDLDTCDYVIAVRRHTLPERFHPAAERAQQWLAARSNR